MKVLLIASNTTSSPYPVFPLGVSIISGVLRGAGHDVAFFDLLESGGSLERLGALIGEKSPEIIGISIRNIDNVNSVNEERYIDLVKELVAHIRRLTGVPIVLGGSGFSIMPEEILEAVGADYGIVGEGELLMAEFVENASRGVYPPERCLRSPVRVSGPEIPSAHYDPGILEFYLKSGNMASVQTKRGCRFGCMYCSYPFLEGARLRCRDPKAVVEDIKTLRDAHDARYIYFTDSVFNDSEGRYLEVLREMRRSGVSIPWTAFFRPEGLDDESVALMKETGLRAAELGSDASTDATLRGIGKSFRFDDVIASNEVFVRHGIATAHFFMFGCPGETRETVLAGIENIKNLSHTVSFIFMGIRILPGTGLFELARGEGVIADSRELLAPVYYIAPGIGRDWLEGTLREAFSGVRHCVFPPDALNGPLRMLHQLGYSGALWEMLIPTGKRRRGRHGAR
jgi:lipid biosynthesis B12-binding/radical SAM protein